MADRFWLVKHSKQSQISLVKINYLGYAKTMDEQMDEKRLTAHVNRLANVIQNTYYNRRTLFINSFLSGLFSGLGATLGVAIIIALLGFLVRKLGGIPVFGQWLNDFNQILPRR